MQQQAGLADGLGSSGSLSSLYFSSSSSNAASLDMVDTPIMDMVDIPIMDIIN